MTNNLPVIRKRTCIPFNINRPNLHILHGRRYSLQEPSPLFFDKNEVVKIIHIIKPGYCDPEIAPILDEENCVLQTCTRIYEKKIHEIQEQELGMFPNCINSIDKIILYLSLIYNTILTTDDFVTLIETVPC